MLRAFVVIALLASTARAEEAEISRGRHAAGAITSIYVGFGVGQAIQGRWLDIGWAFTLADTASVSDRRRDERVLQRRRSAMQAQRAWRYADDRRHPRHPRIAGAVDAFEGPKRHNQRVRTQRRTTPFVAPVPTNGGVAGLMLRF